MKHYMDIENLREFDIDLGNGMIRRRNCQAFEKGDHIVITEKTDGSNFSICFNKETGEFDSFSRKKQLDFNNTLNGAWNYAQSLDFPYFSDNIVVFGEWTGARNKIAYDLDKRNTWYVFDVWDKDVEQYWEKQMVWYLCDTYGFTHVPILYDGEFVDWDHVRSFCNKPSLGTVQEGVVIVNEDKRVDENNIYPYCLKIVNEAFRESKIPRTKPTDEEREVLKVKAAEVADQIVTEARVQKELLKMQRNFLIQKMLINLVVFQED